MEVGKPIFYTKNKMAILHSELNTMKLATKRIKNLIFAELNVEFYRGKRKNKPIEKKYYFKNSKVISESKPELENYGFEYIKRTEKTVRKLIYE